MNHQLASPQSSPLDDGRRSGRFWQVCAIVCLVWSLLSGSVLFAQDTSGDPVPVEAADAPENSGADAAATVDPGEKKVARISTNVRDMIDALGVWAIPFAISSIMLLWFTIDRLVVLRRGRVIPMAFVQRFLRLVESHELDQDEALEVCLQNPSPIANIFAHAVRKWGKPSVEVEQAILDGGERQVGDLRRNLRVIHGIHTITPMIGLLGTVWGMLESFSLIASAGAMGRIDQLAAGIALAFVNTFAGLFLAIPALISYVYFSGRVDSLTMEMDDLSQRLVHSISAEGLATHLGSSKKSNTVKQEAETARKR